MALKFGSLFLVFISQLCQAAPIYLPEDEFTLPPLFSQIASQSGSPGDGMNVISSKNQRRHAVKGEWFDYGDSMSLPESLAFEVIHRENVKWIGGGVFQGQVAPSPWSRQDPAYEVSLKRGWMKVWIKPEPGKPIIRITTPDEVFIAKEAEFWLSVHTGKTELYVAKGEVKPKSSEVPYGPRTYLVRQTSGAKAGSREWDPDAIEVQIAGSFPALGQLMTKAQKDWDSGKSALIYATYRKRGWRQAHRFKGASAK